jgi:hypothetical protein
MQENTLSALQVEFMDIDGWARLFVPGKTHPLQCHYRIRIGHDSAHRFQVDD